MWKNFEISACHDISPSKIRARGLNRREFREYCGLLDLQYGDLVLHCEVRRLSRGQVLRRFLKLNNIVHDFIEEKEELPEEKLFCVIKMDFLFSIFS